MAGDAEPILEEIEEFLTGARHEREADRLLATILFTDLVSSTEQATRLGDRRWRDLLASHDAAVRRALERFHGREVKTLGDGFLAAFDGPARGIRCSCAIRDSLQRLGLEVRSRLHTGECEVVGDDVGGVAVHIASRVMANAQAGEILVSRTVVDLVAGSGIAFRDRGTHQLKGVSGSRQLFAV
jgi:class 3 adenylate cyclase